MCWLIRHWWRRSPFRWETRQCRICRKQQLMKFRPDGTEVWLDVKVRR